LIDIVDALEYLSASPSVLDDRSWSDARELVLTVIPDLAKSDAADTRWSRVHRLLDDLPGGDASHLTATAWAGAAAGEIGEALAFARDVDPSGRFGRELLGEFYGLGWVPDALVPEQLSGRGEATTIARGALRAQPDLVGAALAELDGIAARASLRGVATAILAAATERAHQQLAAHLEEIHG
jgi:hypothetical protein